MAKVPVISIVDDDESVREATKSLVRSLGFSAATFASAEEYLESECAQDTACLIADVQMPGMNGVDLQSRLIADGYDMPIIFVTAFYEQKLHDRAIEAGALGFLRKPFDDNSLINYLDKALGHQTL